VWKYFFTADRFGSIPVHRGDLDLRKGSDSDGNFDSGSTIDSNNITTGTITGKKVEFEHPAETGKKKKYKGEVFFELGDRMIMGGRVEKVNTVKKDERDADDAQEDGSWVATKP